MGYSKKHDEIQTIGSLASTGCTSDQLEMISELRGEIDRLYLYLVKIAYPYEFMQAVYIDEGQTIPEDERDSWRGLESDPVALRQSAIDALSGKDHGGPVSYQFEQDLAKRVRPLIKAP